MKNTCISHKPGDIVQLAGIDFVVLEDRGPFNGEGENHDLFILALEGQWESRFGDTNNYAESELRRRTAAWLDDREDGWGWARKRHRPHPHPHDQLDNAGWLQGVRRAGGKSSPLDAG